jgi:predicted nucleic acid-binding protein
MSNEKQQKQIDALIKDNEKLKKSVVVLQQVINKMQKSLTRQIDQTRRAHIDIQALTRTIRNTQ